MSTLTSTEQRVFERYLRMGEGYVLDFSNRTFADFFSTEMNVDIYDSIWEGGGTSKANLLRSYLKIADDHRAAKLLRALMNYVESTNFSHPTIASSESERCFSIIRRLEAGAGALKTDIIEAFASDDTLDELVRAIDRDVQADKPEASLDRLHTYCMKKFAHLVMSYRPDVIVSTTLNGRAGQYFNELKREAKGLKPISFEIMTATVKMLELFNNIRNDYSLAHDNTLLDKAEARFVFEAICNVLRFVKVTEGQRFGG